MAISTFNARCFALLEDVARTGEPLVVTRRGTPLVRITSSGNRRSRSPQDTLWRMVEILGDVIAPAIPG